ncbi:MAG: hypothetical protein IJK34_07845 [Clostridia bacterium]|nr:hypothetical protein [Clostridia bacterium]
MKKFKAITAVIMVVSVLAICSLSAYGAMMTISCSTSVIWNIPETQAYAKTSTYAPSASHYYADAWIESNTEDYRYAYAFFTTGGSNSVSTDWVSVSYDLPLPLITDKGGHWWTN